MTSTAPTAAHSDPVPNEHAPTPFWALAAVTWINSLGSGLLWSGVPFITEHQYGFTDSENLLLALVLSLIYVAVACSAGIMLRKVTQRGFSARAWLTAIIALQLVGGALALMGKSGLLVGACLLSAVGAAVWPLMESYLSSGRHGHDMRRAIGHFNVAWMSATAASLVLMAPIMASERADIAMVVLIPISLVSFVLLRWFPKHPAPHSADAQRTHVPQEYKSLLHAARFVLLASYIFISVVGPLMPFRMRDAGVSIEWATPLAALWMVARMGTAMLLSYAQFWHGRWGALVLGVALLAGGFAAIILAKDPAMMAAGLVAFGVGHGLLYYAALYYAMAVGAAEVGAAGVFEALIGVGYVIGPIVGLASASQPGLLVPAIWAVAACAMFPALLIWLRRRPHPARP